MLARIEKGKKLKPPRIMIYGTEGIGKTTFASQAKNPVFIQTEDGLGSLEVDRFPLAKTCEEVQQNLSELKNQEHNYNTVVIDSLDWLERLVWDKLCRDWKVSSIEKVDGGYGKGYVHAVTIWRQILDDLNFLRDQKRMSIVLIAHSKVEKFEDPESVVSYDRYSPRLHKLIASLVTEWCDAVLFATRRFRISREETGFGRQRAVAQPIGSEGGDRIIRCIGSPFCVAKNRFSLPEEIPLSWASLVSEIIGKEG
jgi:hypothetical protein